MPLPILRPLKRARDYRPIQPRRERRGYARTVRSVAKSVQFDTLVPVRAFLIFCMLVTLSSVSVAGQSIAGTVVDTRGDAVAGAAVTFDGGGVVYKFVTAAGGTFSIPRVAGKLSVTATGFKPYSIQFDAEIDQPLNIVLLPAPVAVTVTVTRTEEDSLNASIAVITIESLGVTAARTADDTLRQIPGFQLFRRSSSRTTNPTAQGANFRGLAGSGASRATVLFDGLSLNDAFGGWTYWSRVPMIAVEQIEVFSGGASSFYGSGGMSGAVNIVPKTLRDENFRVNIETSAATQNTADMSGIILASRGKWRADVIGDVFKTGGYIPVDEMSRGTVDTPAASRHANVIVKLTRSFGDPGQVFVRGNRFAERRDNGTRLTNNRTNFRQLATGADLASKRYGGLNLRAFGEWQVYDQTFSAVAADRNSESLTRLQRVPSRAVGGSVLWSKKFATHNAIASAEMLQTRGFSDEVGYTAGIATSVSRSGGEARDLSFFIQDNWKALPKFSLDLSARIDARRNSDGIATTRTIATGTLTETRFADRRDTSFSPRIAATYEISEAVAVYASFSQSFRAPSLNELYRGFRVGNIVTEANAFLAPERANSFEAGGSLTARATRPMIARARVFSTRVTDPIVSVTLATTPTLITRQRQNVGSMLSRGLDLDIQFELAPRLKITASYLFVNSEISEFPADPSLVGNRPPQTARHSFTAQARYDIDRRWNVSTQLRTASSQFEDDRNTLRLGKYFTADVRSGFKFNDRVELFAAVENLLNSRYEIGRTPLRTVAAPRSLRLGLRVNLSR